MSALAAPPAVPAPCVHKLPTACGLSGLAACCACADGRPHAAAYPVYVDGLGSVLQGARWGRYCWGCRAFWEARVAAESPPIQSAQTRVPAVPDQTEFLDTWYAYHRGYREVTLQSGEVRREEMLGEPLKDVAPGHLPRSLEELLRLEVESPARDAVPLGVEHPVGDPDGAAAYTESQSRRLSALRRALRRVRRGIGRLMFGLGELSDAVPEARQLTLAGGDIDRQLDLVEEGLSETQEHLHGANASRRATAAHVFGEPLALVPEEEERRSNERLASAFGSREMEQQRAESESLFHRLRRRAMRRDGEAEERLLSDSTATSESSRPASSRSRARPQRRRSPPTAPPPPEPVGEGLAEAAELSSPHPSPSAPYSYGSYGSSSDSDSASASALGKGLDDAHDGRPPPLDDGQMTVSLECKVCYSQIADTAVLPCGHMVMCRWCAEIHIPSAPRDRTAVNWPASCPLCRRKVRQKIKIYRG
ncbi:MAG: hypothetical protein M1832_001441 [Thelocarpon impressellum]|nr:MAG: hypothetical protein M1832_001441 [Thelocarpon impressellum]